MSFERKEIIQLQTTENPITIFHMDYDETHTYIQIDTFKKYILMCLLRC